MSDISKREELMRRSSKITGAGIRRRQKSLPASHFEGRRFVKEGALWLSAVLAIALCACGNMISSARSGDLDGIQRSLNEGISIETRSPDGATPLIVAAYSRRPTTVEFLLERGADVNATDNNHSSALIHAAYYNFYEVAEILVKYNPDLRIKDRYGNTAYDYASQYEHTRILELLKKKMAETPAIVAPPAVQPAITGRRYRLCIFPWKVGGGAVTTTGKNTRRACE